MVNIKSLIDREKNRFTQMKKRRIETETAKLEAQKVREGVLAKALAKKQAARKDLEKIKSYNQKVEGPTKFQKLGKGLTRAINKAKENKAKGRTLLGTKGKSGGVLMEGNSSFNYAGPGFKFGGEKKSSPFMLGQPTKKQEVKKKRKEIRVIIQR